MEKIKGQAQILMLPLVSMFPDKTSLEEEQPGLEALKACEGCDHLVWVSKKKRELLKQKGKLGQNEIFALCYVCVEDFAKMRKAAGKGMPPMRNI